MDIDKLLPILNGASLPTLFAVVIIVIMFRLPNIIQAWRDYQQERDAAIERHDKAQSASLSVLERALSTADGMVSQLNTMNYSKAAAETTARNALAQLEAVTGEIAKRDAEIAGLKLEVNKLKQDNTDLRRRIDELEKKPARKGKKNENDKTSVVGGGAVIARGGGAGL